VIEEALRLLRASLPATISIRTTFDPGAPDIAADATQIHQVIMNLGANAAHAIGDHAGQLEFRLAPVRVDASLTATSTALHEGQYARLSVSDTGCGIDPATLERIFEPFFTTKMPGHGTGLGLSVVHGIIKSHGGGIVVDSQPGQGTTFHLYLPAAEGAVPESAETPIETPRGHGERLLYVDDEDQLAILALRGLQRLGYEVTAFHDARQALDAFHAQPSGFDVVITDLAMPGMNGLAFAAEIRRLGNDAPVIITSGYLRPQDIEAAQRLGIRELVRKPTSIDNLARSIQRTLQSR
jgi:CheY-like chemotaxis protein